MMEAYSTRGCAQWMKGLKGQAIEDMKAAVKLKPDAGGECLFLGYFTHEEGRKAEAEGYFARAFEVDPQIVERIQTFGDLTEVASIRELYEQVADVARLYRGGGQGKQEVHDYELREEEVMEMQPADPVAAGGEFDLVVEYTVADPHDSSDKLMVAFSCSII
jgi:tetratricopeptide (TPR) repeat protein